MDICGEEFFYEMSLAMLPLICKVVTSDASIKADCFDLLYCVMKVRPLMPTLFPTLVSVMNLAKPPFKKSKTAWILGEFASAGHAATKTLIDDQIIPALVKQSPIINGGILCRLMFFLSKDGDGERYDVNIRQDACQILSIVVMCDNKGLKILALSFDDGALVLLCALVTIDTASTLYGLKALKKVSNCTIISQHIFLYAIFTKNNPSIHSVQILEMRFIWRQVNQL